MKTNVLDILGYIGYSKGLAEKRVRFYENAGKGGTLYERGKFGVDYDIVIAGSRGDGTGIYVDCDVDKILVQNNIKCYEKECDVNKNISDSTLFELDTSNVPDGYAKLKFISKADGHSDEIHTNIEKALEEINGTQYLRNDHKLSPAIGHTYVSENCGWLEKNLVHADTKSGPSKPYKIQTPLFPNYILLDDVLAFRCENLSVIEEWCKRERKHDWPPKDLIDKVRNFDAFVVPVGVKGSENEHLQWRVCLTLAELALVQSFNDIQIKVYGALKMITKHFLTPICENITSYIVKTVLFWQLEQTVSTEWTAENFEEKLVNTLRDLNACIKNEQLPNYMIPARNMLQNKISTSAVKQNLTEMIDFLIKEHPYIYIKHIVLKNLANVETGESTQKTKLETHEEKLSPEETSLTPKEIVQSELQNEQSVLLEEDIPESGKQAIMQRKLREELVLTIFALPPEEMAAILKKVFEAKEQSEICEKISLDVLPYIRRENPFGFFTKIKSMDDEEIYEKCAGSDKQSCSLL